MRDEHGFWLGGFFLGAVLGHFAWWAAVVWFVVSVLSALAVGHADRQKANAPGLSVGDGT